MINLDAITKIAERKIQDAIEEGKFENLPGAGKPIVFDEDLVTPPHLRMANRILRNANVLPEWIQVQKDIQSEREEVIAFKAGLLRENAKWGTRLAALPASHAAVTQYAEWHAKSRTAYLRHLKSVNTSILKFCLLSPSNSTPYASYKIEAEMISFDADFQTRTPQASASDVDAKEEGRLRGAARRYYLSGSGALSDWVKAFSLFGKDRAGSEDAPESPCG